MVLKLLVISIVLLLALPLAALLLNRVPLFDPPGPGTRLAAYLGTNVRETSPDSRFPELRPRHYPGDAKRVHAAVVEAMGELGWEVVAVDADEARVHGVVTTALWRFKDDVRVQVIGEGDSSRVRVRSASRVGKGDLGANTRHILDLFGQLNQRLGGS